jgi:hypothetical protein
MSLFLRAAELRQDFERSRLQFLLTDLDTGAIFCEVAQSSNDPEKRKRNQGNARKAYDMVLKFQDGVIFDAKSKAELERKLSRLQLLLKRLGEDV